MVIDRAGLKGRAICLVLVALLGAVACEAAPAEEPSDSADGPAWVAFDDTEAGVAGRAPSDWSVVTGEAPEWSNPSHVLSVGTIDLEWYAERERSPLGELAPGEVIIEVLERTGAEADFEPWPESFGPGVMRPCPRPLDCLRVSPANDFQGWRGDFERSGRQFHVFVFMGLGTVHQPVGSLAWQILDAVRLAPA